MPPASKSEMHRSDLPEGVDRRPAETPTSAALVCGECGGVNPLAHKFCTSCGASLSEACPHCGEKSFAGEKFCGACGVNLAAAAQQAIEQFEANLATVEQLRAGQRYDEALALLNPMSSATHSRLVRYAGRASQLIRLVTAERERGRLNAETAYQEAQRLIAAQQIDRAADVLEAVPPSLRDASIQSLLRDLSDRRQEAARLSKSLRNALADGRAADAVAMLGRILELRPEDAGARKLADQLLAKYCASAERKMARGRHQEALRLLDEVPSLLAVGTVGDRYRQVAEWAGLVNSLRTAAVIDPAVLAMAERLRVVAPKDAESTRLVVEILRRAKEAAESAAADFPALAIPPRETALGFPVDFLPPFRRIVAAEKLDRQWLIAQRGRLAVACGLALQGLDKVEVATNLLPGARQGGLSSFAQSLFRPSAAWGIDIGSTSLKAVRLAWNPKDRLAAMEAAECLEYRKPLAQAANADEQAAMIDEVLADLIARHRLRGPRICLGLPGRLTMLQRLRVPAADPVKLAAMIRHEIPRYVPISLDKLYWAYHVMEAMSARGRAGGESPAGSPGPKMVPVQFCAARSNLVAPRMEAMERAKLQVDVLQSEFLALHNLWAFENTAEDESGKGKSGNDKPAKDNGGKAQAEEKQRQPERAPFAVVLLDVGGDGSNLVVSSQQGIWARSLNFGGHMVTRTLVKELGLTFAQAEQLKRSPSAAPGVYSYCRAVSPALEDLYRDVEQCLESFSHSDQQETIGRMVGLGGEFALHGLLRQLRAGRPERSVSAEPAGMAGHS